MRPLDIVVLGLSITSSWGNGHAVTYRSLLRALAERGHRVTFLERDAPWYAQHRDLAAPEFCRTLLYGGVEELCDSHGRLVREADLVIVGSYVPDGIAVASWALETARGLVAFYDIDTPVTLAALERGDCAYLAPELVPQFDVYFSFTGGPTLALLERRWGAWMARPLYCSVDPAVHRPEEVAPRWELGYLGTYSADRQLKVEALLNGPARALPDRRFVIAGAQYPETIDWAPNVARLEHVPPDRHGVFYGAQRFTLNLTRADMAVAGWSPSVRLFEAAACGAPVISDDWPGLDSLFQPEREILIARCGADVLRYLRETPEAARREIGKRARERVLAMHTAERRAAELELRFEEAAADRRWARGVARPASLQLCSLGR